MKNKLYFFIALSIALFIMSVMVGEALIERHIAKQINTINTSAAHEYNIQYAYLTVNLFKLRVEFDDVTVTLAQQNGIFNIASMYCDIDVQFFSGVGLGCKASDTELLSNNELATYIELLGYQDSDLDSELVVNATYDFYQRSVRADFFLEMLNVGVLNFLTQATFEPRNSKYDMFMTMGEISITSTTIITNILTFIGQQTGRTASEVAHEFVNNFSHYRRMVKRPWRSLVPPKPNKLVLMGFLNQPELLNFIMTPKQKRVRLNHLRSISQMLAAFDTTILLNKIPLVSERN